MTNLGFHKSIKEAYISIGANDLQSLPNSWKARKLGSLLKPVSIKNRPDLQLLSITREQGVIVRDIEDEGSNHNFIPDDLSGYKVLQAGQFGMNKMKAWQGSYGISKHTGIVSPAYFIFDFLDDIEPAFFNWAIRSKLYVSFFGQASDGVRIGQWDLSKPRMNVIPFLYPSKSEQKSIANFLDDKTEKIERAIAIKEKQIELLKERKQIFIQNAVTRGLNPDAPMKDSGVDWIGEIPAHWDVKKLKYVARIHNGRDHKHVISESGFPVYGSGGQFAYALEYLYEGEAVLLGRKGTIDKPIYVNEKFWTVDTMFYTIPNQLMMAKFLFYAAKCIPFSYYSTSTALPSMTQGDLLGHKIITPPINEQEEIIANLDSSLGKLEFLNQKVKEQIRHLKEYKASLINSAVTGKIKVTT